MASKTSFAITWFVAFLVFSSTMCAQNAKPPSLKEILQRLDANLNHYDTGVPSFFCDEHVVSEREPGRNNQNTVTDSVFRLKRIPSANHMTTLVESRDVKSINGKPSTSQDLDGPALLSGAFEGGLAVVSLNQAACMNYSLQRIHENRPDAPYIVRFATVLTPQNSTDCLLQEDSTGRIFVDHASMQITHLELTTPHHAIIPGDSYSTPVIGKRVVTVDYGPIPLGGETFWMPSKITMRSTSDSGTFHITVWSFSASYRNYHKLGVETHILFSGEVHTP